MSGSRGTANLVMRCKFCKRESSARKFTHELTWWMFNHTGKLEFDSSFPIQAYSAEQNGKFQKIAVFDCRGLELVDFAPKVSTQRNVRWEE